jgi:heat shock protein HslJ/uncharacterized lipoprotein NlpE involved in copper resistance
LNRNMHITRLIRRAGVAAVTGLGLWLASGFASAQAPAAAPAGLALPASFVGILPCADCAGIAQTLSLREDGLYRLRRTYLGKPGNPSAEIGRWRLDVGGRLLLRSGSGQSQFEVTDANTLRQLDRAGQPIRSALNYSLRRTAAFDAINESLRWRGEMIYMADAANFTDCASGLRWPIPMIEGYLALERAYTQGRNAPGAPLLVSFDGRLQTMPDMEGPPREHLVVERFEATEPGRRCHPAEAPRATLTNTYWKLTEMAGSPVAMLPGQTREVRITLDGPGTRVHGFSGCNRLQGQYASSGDRLAFSALGGTRMACPAPVMALETAVLQALGRSTGYRIDGEALSLQDGERVLARFAAVYLR